jgi:hypothetical protein
MTSTRRTGDWQALAEDHRAALGQFLATARRIPPQSWTMPLAPVESSRYHQPPRPIL